MVDPTQEEVISLVNTIFEVSDFTKTEFSLEFKIENIKFKSKFEDLARRLEGMRYVGKLEEIDGVRYIIIQKFPLKKQRKVVKHSMDS